MNLRYHTTFVMVALLAGCAREGGYELSESVEGPNPGAVRPERQYPYLEPQMMWRVTSDASDTTLVNPYITASFGEMVVVAEAEQRLVAFNGRGEVVWRAGWSGSGPGEFIMIRDLASDDSTLFALDGQLRRISRFDRSGKFLGSFALPDGLAAEEMAALPGGRLAVITLGGEDDIVILDANGGVVGAVQVPWDGYRLLEPMARDAVSASDHDGNWVLAFTSGDGWFAFDDSIATDSSGLFLEEGAFPQVVTHSTSKVRQSTVSRAPAAALEVVYGERLVEVLFGGTEKALWAKVVDTFDPDSKQYQGSYLLDRTAVQIARVGDTLYALGVDSVPSLTKYLVPLGN